MTHSHSHLKNHGLCMSNAITTSWNVAYLIPTTRKIMFVKPTVCIVCWKNGWVTRASFTL